MIKRLYILLLFVFSLSISFVQGQTSLGEIIPNTNLALPDSYNFHEYVFPEPDDQGLCVGNNNETAQIADVFFSQTHRHSITHPFFFIIGHRPALLQLAVTGTGSAPDVKVEGFIAGSSIGTLCLKGPQVLSENLNTAIPSFEDYFTVTIPKAWVRQGLELKISAGDDEQILDSDTLKIGPYTEMNLVEVKMDVLDYNTEDHKTPIIDNFLQEMASSIPASVIRYGQFPETLLFPELIANNDTEQLIRLKSKGEKENNGILSDGSINSVMTLALGNLHHSTGDYLSTVFFGNTLNLDPGGWGGGKSFVSFDFDDVFIHELGHALSLPHWGESAYDIPDPNEYQYLYPYGGANNDGGGRGESWNFIQDIYEFIDPICQYDQRGIAGLETSDAMQRNNHCLGKRSESQGPWDGFGDFSALAIHRYLVGASVRSGQVEYKDMEVDYQFNMQQGFPNVSLENGIRTYRRSDDQPDEFFSLEENVPLPGVELLNQQVYLIYGSAHETQERANIVHKPIKFNGTLPPIIDPTDESIFEAMKDEKYRDYSTRDITLKIFYEDGSVLHVLNPHHSYARAPYTWGFHIWRDDICNYSIVVPGDKKIVKVEQYKRPFVVANADDPIEGNIKDSGQGITASNFMEGATYQTEWSEDGPKTVGPNAIGNRVWHDLNKNGLDDFNEPGIKGVVVILWGDSDADGIPDGFGFKGFRRTDENGNFRFDGLTPGKYLVFVWNRDNWEEGEPLHGMVSSEGHSDPNNDINKDDNGRPGDIEFPGLTNLDIASGIIELTADGEPLDDGDPEHYWFDYDASGNMTVDFGFYFEDGCPDINAEVSGKLLTCDEELGNISLSPTSGEGPYSYEWNTGDTTESIENLQIGTYTVTITDQMGCIGELAIDIALSPQIEIMIDVPDSLCAGALAFVNLDISGGILPYAIVFSSGFVNGEVGIGDHSIMVTDESGCEKNFDFTIKASSDAACVSGIKDELISHSFSIFPNPFSDAFHIEAKGLYAYQFHFMTIEGRPIQVINLVDGSTLISTDQLPSGMYIGIMKDKSGKIIEYVKLLKI